MKVEVRVDVRDAAGGMTAHVLGLEMSRGDGIPEQRVAAPMFVSRSIDGEQVDASVFHDVMTMCGLGGGKHTNLAPPKCGPVTLPCGGFPVIDQELNEMTADGMIAYARRLVSITEAATAFVLAHCEFETRGRPQVMQDLITDLHGRLEHAVIGDEQVPGRQPR